MKRTALTVLLLLALPVFAHNSRQDDADLRHWRVIWTERPESQATLSWTTASAGNTHVVHYDTVSRTGEIEAYKSRVAAKKNGRFTGKKPEIYYHHAYLTGLKPATTYYFVMASDNSVSREFHFVTAPAKDVPFKLLFGGDSRSSPSNRRKMNERMAALLEADAKILALAHGGDFVGDGRKLDEWDVWLSDHEKTITRRGRMLPVIPARGNHESSGKQYDEVFGWPGNVGENYFTTRLGPKVVLVTLNSNISTAGNQARFLDKSLAAHRKFRWQLVQYHRPVYPAVKSSKGNKRDWVPIFEKYNIDLACEADGHCIKRTVPIRKDKADPTGVTYIGEGGLGVSQRTPKKGLWFLDKPGVASKGHHVFLLSFSKKALGLTIVLMSGKVFNEHALRPRRR